MAKQRIACVQNGDYAEALRALRGAGGAETYQGQFATVGAFEDFVADATSLVISIGQRPERVERDGGAGTMLTIRKGGPKWLPGRVRDRLVARRILRELKTFRPTHVIVRVTGIVGNLILDWSTRNKLPSAALIATTFNPSSELDRRFCALANDDGVAFVANHLRVATQSLVTCGLKPEKAVEYDVPGRLSPEDFPVKSLGDDPQLLYVGVLSEAKGAGDVLDGVKVLRERGRRWPLTVCGDGPLADRFRAVAADASLGITYLGRTPREQVAQLVRAAACCFVPSRPVFAEGLPLTLLEALATRTPVVASAHPVFVSYFKDGVGTCFFEPASPASLADATERLLGEPRRYAEVSRLTRDAWAAAQTELLFPELFDRLRAEWPAEK